MSISEEVKCHKKDNEENLIRILDDEFMEQTFYKIDTMDFG